MRRGVLKTGLIAMVVTCIGCSTQETNPLLQEWTTPGGVPPFDQIKNEHYMPAFKSAMAKQNKAINAIVKSSAEPTFESVILPFEYSGEELSKVAKVFYGLNSAHTSDSLQAIQKELTPLMSQHSDNIRLNPTLFAKIKAVYDNLDNAALEPDQRKLVEEIYKSFVRNGAELDAESQEELRKLNADIAMLQVRFGQNLLAETNGKSLLVEKEEDLAGLPAAVIATAKAAAEVANKEGWLFTLHNPSIMPFLQFADNAELREQIMQYYLNRGNNDNENDNKEVVKELVQKRLDKANLLGYICYADYVLETRMAETTSNVYALLNQIWEPALNRAKEERDDMVAMMKAEGLTRDLRASDWYYYSEKVRQKKYDLNEEELRPYFALNNVRQGIFYLAEKLYGIRFIERPELPKYHQDVVTFECQEADGTSLGYLYMDFHPRASKRGGAWCGTYKSNQNRSDGTPQTAVVTIVCNFTQPVGDAPALLSPDEVNTFFHEFGHALHNFFMNVRYPSLLGVPRDFVELPSQVMEHWAFEPQMLAEYAKHYQTGEVIPDALVKKLIDSGKFGQGFATTEYLAASLLDMDYHTLTDASDLDVLQFEASTLKDKGLIEQIPPRYRSTYFNHTMGGGYTAGYYSYIWSEVLDADAFEAYKESGDIFNKEIAARFREHILAPGQTQKAADMYENFRGFAPNNQALLRNRGLL